MRVFGEDDMPVSKLILPKASLTWKIDSLDSRTFDNILLYSFTWQLVETIDIRKCFNDVNHIFSFGKNIAQNTFTVVLAYFPYVNKKCGQNLAVEQLDAILNEMRVYVSKKSVQVTIDDITRYGFLISATIGSYDPKTGLCFVYLTFIEDTNN